MQSWLSEDRFLAWQKVVPTLRKILDIIDIKTTIAIGSLPYPRIIPALFLKNYQIYCVADVADTDILRHYTTIFSMEEKAPKQARKVQSTSYLLGNYMFQSFLKSRRYPFRLLLQQATPPIVKKLAELKIEWVGNNPDFVEHIKLKSNFRALLSELNLPRLEDWKVSRQEFIKLTYQELINRWQKPVVIQRGDKEVGGVQGTFFIKNIDDFNFAFKQLSTDSVNWQVAQISPFIEGHSVSMLGCVTHLGILTSPLQLQLIDIPASLDNAPATGQFLGHDWSFADWQPNVENKAQYIMEVVGQHLAKQGFKGIFGIDFMYDKNTHELFPTECNPRYTGALPLYSFMVYGLKKVPPLDFFHLMSQLGIKESFDFSAVNQELKHRIPLAHIAIAPFNLEKVKLSLQAGLYSFNEKLKQIHYKEPAAFPWHITNPRDFIIIDSIPRQGAKVNQNVPRLFKLIFRRPIAQSSYQVDEETSVIIKTITASLRA